MPDDRGPRILADHGVHYLRGPIDDDTVGDAVEFVLEANLNREHESLTMIVNSEGGCVTNGFALVDVMAGSKLPIHTVGLGQISSMGLTIFIAGHKGTRLLTPNTLILCHQFSAGVGGKQHELLASMKQWEQIRDRFTRHYVKHSGLTKKQVEDILFPASDVYLEAKEAKRLGLCDAVKDW